MKTGKILLLIIGFIVLLIGIDFGFGYLGVFKTKTVGKAKQNVETEVFYESQAFDEGKKREALKFYKEYKQASATEKASIELLVSHSFASYNEDKLNEPLKSFIRVCKY